MTFLFLTALVIATITIALISMPSISYAKSGLTIVLKFKYSKVADKHPEYYDKVRLTIGKYFNEYYNLKKDEISFKYRSQRIEDPRRYKFEVHWNNPNTDDGEQIDMKNTKCNCKEVGTIKVP